MKYLFLLPALLLSACEVKVKGNPPPPAAPKPVTCARAVNRDVPQSFQSLGTAVGAVKTEACDTLVVGHTPQGEVVIAKYNEQGQADDLFGDHGVMKPLQARYASAGVRVQRVAVINNGYFAFGSYGEAGEARALFAFRFLDSGFLDLAYGPRRDGVAKASSDARFNLLTVGVPLVEGELIRLRNRVEDVANGTEAEREQNLLVGGSQAMPKDLQPVPASCALINHTAFTHQTQVQIQQSGCGDLVFQASGPLGNDNLSVAVNGTVYFSNFLGEMRWSYEGPQIVLVSRDGLGFIKKEYASFVQGPSYICGASVDSRRRYLVFSAKTPQFPDWLADCWFL